MPTKPSVLLSWATAGGAVLTEPSGTLQSNGYLTRDLPADGEFNYIVKNAFDWLAYYNAGGLGYIVLFANITLMKAYTDPNNGQIAALTGVGLYRYDASSTASGDDFNTIDPDQDGNGRWILIVRNTLLVSGSTTEGRLTLTTGTPVITSPVTAATTLYFTPYKGNLISLYDGSKWNLYSFTELTLNISAYTANKNYDIWIYNNSGTITLDSTIWTNDTTRATALVYQNGVYVKSGDATRKYLGTIRITGTTGQCEFSFGGSPSSGGTEAKLFVQNYYNQVIYQAAVRDSTDSWNFNTAPYRAANNSSTMRVSFISGAPELRYSARYFGLYDFGVNSTYGIGIGLNSTSANSAIVMSILPTSPAGEIFPITAEWEGAPAAGFNYVTALERATASFIFVGYGDNGDTVAQSGLIFRGSF